MAIDGDTAQAGSDGNAFPTREDAEQTIPELVNAFAGTVDAVDASQVTVVEERLSGRHAEAARREMRQMGYETTIDPDAQCREHGCSRWECDEAH